MKLFSIRRTTRKTVVKIGFLKFSMRNRKFSPERLRATPESEYPALLEEWYRLSTGERLDLRAPRTFRQKIQWLKLYGDMETMRRLADKVRVRDYVAAKIGERRLIDVLGVYKKAEEIDWAALPRRFVLKPNHASGWVKVVEDKTALDIPAVCREADGWLAEDYSVVDGFQMQYRGIPPRLVVERHLGELTRDLRDYKVWCFGGKPLYVQVVAGRRDAGGCTTAFYSADWKRQPFWRGYPPCSEEVPKPACIEEMLSAAAALSEGMPFVRADFYVLDDGSFKFGELTFTPGSGEGEWHGEDGVDGRLGALVALPGAKGAADGC